MKKGNGIGATSRDTLDPSDWKDLRAQGHRMLDDMLDYLEHIRERPVWQPIPQDVRTLFQQPLPKEPTDLATVHETFMQDILPFAVGNTHPGFMGWVHGGGTPVGMLAEMLAAGLNANLGGRDQMPIEVERQLVQWVRELFGFPETATGLFVTGTSMANLMSVLVARTAAMGVAVRHKGVGAGDKRLIAYTSAGAHGCIAQAMDLSGLGIDALRIVSTDDQHRMDAAALERTIAADWSAGLTPFFIAGTVGTVDVGAIDNLGALADIAHREGIWFHVDGAYGALAVLAPDIAPRLEGIERADSIAFDFHKWGQVPYDAGFILVRDGALHHATFASPAAYLRRETRGMAAGSPWPCDFGPDLSRGFRALKTWFTIKVYGAEKLGQVISDACALARHMGRRIEATPLLELLAPVSLNIVCFRYRSEDSDRVNADIVTALQESGIVAPSTTTINGRLAIRAAIVNHRTDARDIDALLRTAIAFGETFAKTAQPRKAL
ncbi:MAG TPA: cytochrome D ubiquinol oxidase subunit I [Betaproteobacteria bacterium]|nr:cytochrome D ubiquinol oxidase subunit I [Betaproteobacteria bacterium]